MGIPGREPEPPQIAVSFLPYIPINNSDILFVDSLSKNISGTGMGIYAIGHVMVTGKTDP